MPVAINRRAPVRYRLRPLQCCGSGMRSRNRRYSESLGRLHITGIGCGFRAYGSDIDADLAAAHHDGDRAVARHEPEDFAPYRIGDGAWRASSTEHMSLSDICRTVSSKRVSCVSQESASASSLGLKYAARNNRASSSGAIPLSAVTKGNASWTDDQASPANAKSAGMAMVSSG